MRDFFFHNKSRSFPQNRLRAMALPFTKTYILFNKPFGVLSQFTHQAGYRSLREFGPFPLDVYPVGRLDADSEGLLLLTNDNSVKHRLIDPAFEHPRTYWAQLEGIPTEDALQKLRDGVVVENIRTKPAGARILTSPPDVPPRPKPIRFRKNIPTAWIELIIREGRNRQVRKMTAAVGFPTLRLLRTAIAFLDLGSLKPGEFRTLTTEEEEKIMTMIVRSA
jgi:23S rRNA pseudouridine2457 synthase